MLRFDPVCQIMKRITITILVIIAIIFGNGCYYVFYGQSRSYEKLQAGRRLNLYECCSVYSIHSAATIFSGILSPEAAHQCFLMQFAKDGSFHSKVTDFMKSEYIRNQVALHGGESFVIDYPLCDITGNKDSPLRKELRYALAYDGATYKWVDGHSILELEAKYDGYIAHYRIGWISFALNQHLLRHIQERGWLHICHITNIDRNL